MLTLSFLVRSNRNKSVTRVTKENFSTSSNSRYLGERSFSPAFDSQDIGQKLTPKNWEKMQLPPVNKNFYTPPLSTLSPEQVAEWRNSHNITLFGNGFIDPILSFDGTPFAADVVSRLKNMFPQPTPIQSQGWPIALAGRDMVGCAETGSGKTLSFILPAFEHIKNQVERTSSPVSVVLAPTRELAQQIAKEAVAFNGSYRMRLACLFGGQGNRMQQLSQLKQQPSIIVATPGRLIDFAEDGILNLERVSYLVLDEADRMLDMGFEPQIRKVLSQIRPERQTLMWSATWPQKIANLSGEYLVNPLRIKIGNSVLTANPNISQNFFFCSENERLPHLKQLLIDNPVKTLLFCTTKRNCELLSYHFEREKISHGVLHGEKTQIQRNFTLQQFRTGTMPLVIATDVAARGLDVKDIGLVINYDFPNNIEDYIHRIGRTARAGKTGKSLSYFMPENYHMTYDLMNVLRDANQQIPTEFNRISENVQAIKNAEQKAKTENNRIKRLRGGSSFDFNFDDF